MNSRLAFRPTIVFDGDDTLWETQGLYDTAKDQFFGILEGFGHGRDDVASKFAAVDVANVAEMGFSPERFPRSMRQTYEFYCRSRGEVADEKIADEIEAIGRAVFETRAELRPDALTVLHELREHFRVVLFTAGDDAVQRRRVKETGVAAHADDVIIVPAKTAGSWRSLLSMLNMTPPESWSVGNSVRSDINPALELGLRSILVTANSWEYERASVTAGKNGLLPWHASSLMAAKEIILFETYASSQSE